MGYIFPEFPGNNEYDMDLGWLIKEYKKLLNEYAEILKTVQELEDLYEDIPDRIKEAIDTATRSIYIRMKQLESELENNKALIREIKEEISELRNTSEIIWRDIRNWVRWQNEILKAQVQTMLDNFVIDMPSVICPVDGNRESVQKAIFDVWNGRSLGVPVWLFDSLAVTEAMMNEWNLPVWMFDRYGLLIYAFYKALWMTSPVSGEWVSVKKVTEELANLHKNGVTVQEFDSKMITVEVFDNANITVYEHDWTREWFENL